MPYHCVEKIERALNDAGKAVQGRADRAARRHLQAGRRRRARVARAEDHQAARRARRRPRLPRPARARPRPTHGLRSLPLDEALEGADLVVIVTAHPDDRPRRVVVDAAPLVLDLRGVTRRRPRRRTWCGSDGGPARHRRRRRASATGARTSRATSPRSPDCELRWCCDARRRRARGSRRRRARAARPTRPRRAAGRPRARRGRARHAGAHARRARRAGARRRQALLRREAAGAVGAADAERAVEAARRGRRAC